MEYRVGIGNLKPRVALIWPQVKFNPGRRGCGVKGTCRAPDVEGLDREPTNCLAHLCSTLTVTDALFYN